MLHRGPSLRKRFLERSQLDVVAFQPFESGFGRGETRSELIRRAVKPRGQPPVDSQSGLERLKPRRIIAPPLGKSAEGIGDLAGFISQPLERRNSRTQLGRRIGEWLERPCHLRQHVLCRSVGFVEQGIPGRSRGSDVTGVAQQIGLASQLRVLTWFRVRPRQLVAFVFQQSALPLARLDGFDQRLPLPAECVVFLPSPRVSREPGAEPPVGIQQVTLSRRFEQRPSLELAVDVDQDLPQFFECADGDGQPVDVGAAAPCAAIRRVMMSAPSSSAPPSVLSISALRAGPSTSKTAAARASVLPVRIISADALPPSTSASAVRRRLLPAPVSPVQAQYPPSSSTRTSSMSARFCTESSRSTDFPDQCQPLVGFERISARHAYSTSARSNGATFTGAGD